MVTTEQLADWDKRIQKAVWDPDAESLEEMRELAKEIEQAWLEAMRRECA